MLFVDRYGICGLSKLACDVVISRLSFPGIKVMRRPYDIRGKRYVKIGKGFDSGVGLRIDALPLNKKVCVEIGRDVQINDYVHISACESVKIGNNVLMASKIFISDNNHGFYGFDDKHSDPFIPPIKRPLSHAPVEIGDNVWIGEFVAVLSGVRIGEGAVVGAMSVVNKDIPPFCMAVGSPARVIKKFNFTSGKWEAA
jgi:lipopolysaccharide O-acetyltransferase